LAVPATGSGGEVCRDPIADYLAMNVPDRVTGVGHMLLIKVVHVDLDGNGQQELFVGTWYRKSAPNTWLWAGYAPVPGGFQRITADDTDTLIDFDNIYVGPLPGIAREGMAQAYSLKLDAEEREQSNLISDVTFYFMADGRLVEQNTGPLDREDPGDEQRYETLFGSNRKVRERPVIETITTQDLLKRRYLLPDWAK
jgi:hypothetical protein